jgi:hypothetical protein
MVVARPFLSPLRNNILARDTRPLHLGYHRRHLAFQPAEPFHSPAEARLHAILPLERLHVQLDLSGLDESLLLARVEKVVVALEAVAQLLGLVRGDGGGHGAFERCDVLEEFLLLGDQVCDTAALARVEGFVDGFWFGGGLGEEGI